ncbi:gephyrin-like molybdotransferase Glp [Corynebacterium pelargi]|uniref:Molybdopterin molybdenumtransferase n=1 Tax=Corynebacterium pelargi TaxID=1471400 RepID=A0A410W9Z2_9CORY|nr:gephyrin-like molybdotransferase Glp [Corynebacterium pelargi]QAU52770.1 Molybdopterin molybdenumtransferase [Corynebacterium pelargi]GGG78652.1 molybdopterin molybdenumtransferase [Corynebacterium pelargi]
MRSVEQQLAIVEQAAVVPEPVRIAIAESLGLMCAEEVQATRPLPGFDQAVIDGYAIRAVDIGGERGLARGSGPVAVETSLPVVGEVAAGSQKPLRLQPKQAVRVHTGAPIPALADAVLPLEWSDRGKKRVTATRPVRSGEFVRKAGDDITPGDVAISSGAIIGPAHIGLLAAVGRSKVLVYPRPRLSIISIGHELVDIDRDPGLGQVFDVNSYALAAAGRDAGADVHRVGIAAGEPRRIRDIIEAQAVRSEIIVISGAVGGSGSEHVREVLQQIGEVDTTRVAMHPGSVQGFGMIADDTPVFLLPSNPVSSLVIFETFVRPMIRLCLGKRNPKRRTVRARALNHVGSKAGRRGFVRARLMRDAETQDYLVEGLGAANGAPAHLLAGMSEANAMIQIPEEVTEIRPGDIVEVIFLSQGR